MSWLKQRPYCVGVRMFLLFKMTANYYLKVVDTKYKCFLSLRKDGPMKTYDSRQINSNFLLLGVLASTPALFQGFPCSNNSIEALLRLIRFKMPLAQKKTSTNQYENSMICPKCLIHFIKLVDKNADFINPPSLWHWFMVLLILYLFWYCQYFWVWNDCILRKSLINFYNWTCLTGFSHFQADYT